MTGTITLSCCSVISLSLVARQANETTDFVALVAILAATSAFSSKAAAEPNAKPRGSFANYPVRAHQYRNSTERRHAKARQRALSP